MSKVPPTSEAKEFHLHPAGGPYGFTIEEVKDYRAKVAEDQPPDTFIFACRPTDRKDERCKASFFVPRSSKSWTLKKLVEACGLSVDESFDSGEFVGKSFQAVIRHSQNKDKSKTYANLVDSSIAPISDAVNEDDSDLPF